MRFLPAFLLIVLNPAFTLEIHDHPISNPERVALMQEYAQRHYGSPEAGLQTPLLIVIHDTETVNLAQTFREFEPNLLGDTRPDLGSHGDVNVSIHFVVDRDGTVYQLLPLDQMARHVIGFNYTALGIENVARSENSLTEAQLNADAELVAFLVTQRPSVRYLIGHYEYRMKNLPHYTLWREQDPDYRPTDKTDPGVTFITDLRKKLHSQYHLDFLD